MRLVCTYNGHIIAERDQLFREFEYVFLDTAASGKEPDRCVKDSRLASFRQNTLLSVARHSGRPVELLSPLVPDFRFRSAWPGNNMRIAAAMSLDSQQGYRRCMLVRSGNETLIISCAGWTMPWIDRYIYPKITVSHALRKPEN